jgi:hypothetical protein
MVRFGRERGVEADSKGNNVRKHGAGHGQIEWERKNDLKIQLFVDLSIEK